MSGWAAGCFAASALIASIVPLSRDEADARRATVTLHSGEELQLERTGDLGNGNAGMLIFADGDERPEYVPWADIERIDLDDPGRVFSAPGNLMKRTPP